MLIITERLNGDISEDQGLCNLLQETVAVAISINQAVPEQVPISTQVNVNTLSIKRDLYSKFGPQQP